MSLGDKTEPTALTTEALAIIVASNTAEINEGKKIVLKTAAETAELIKGLDSIKRETGKISERITKIEVNYATQTATLQGVKDTTERMREEFLAHRQQSRTDAASFATRILDDAKEARGIQAAAAVEAQAHQSKVTMRFLGIAAVTIPVIVSMLTGLATYYITGQVPAPEVITIEAPPAEPYPTSSQE